MAFGGFLRNVRNRTLRDGQVRLAPGQDVENLRGTNPWPQSFSLDQQTTARIGSALNSDWLVLGSFTALGHTEPGSLRLDVCLQRAATGQIVSEFSQVGTERDIFDLVSKAGDRLREHLGVTRMEERDVANVLSAMPLSGRNALLCTGCDEAATV